MQKRVITLVLPVVLIALIASCDDDSSTEPTSITYRATLTPAAEVNANGSSANVQSTATGTWEGVLNRSTNTMTYTLSYQGLGSNSRFGHIHAPAATTTTAGVVIDFTSATFGTMVVGATSGTATGTVNFANNVTIQGNSVPGDSLRKLMDLGLTYVNVHSQTYGGGEIRGQVIKQ